MFCNCTSLTTAFLPQCMEICLGVFGGCDNLTTVFLPQCTSVGSRAFNNCNKLKKLVINKEVNLNWFSDWGLLPDCVIYNETRTEKLINGEWISI